jgi:predicted small secreted protein
MKANLLRLTAILALAGLTACNTMRGVGEDITAMGRYISNSTGTAPAHGGPPPAAGF